MRNVRYKFTDTNVATVTTYFLDYFYWYWILTKLSQCYRCRLVNLSRVLSGQTNLRIWIFSDRKKIGHFRRHGFHIKPFVVFCFYQSAHPQIEINYFTQDVQNCRSFPDALLCCSGTGTVQGAMVWFWVLSYLLMFSVRWEILYI